MAEVVSLSTILTGAGSGIAVPFINKMLGPAADEIGLMLGERVRLFRLQNQFKLFRAAQQMLTVAGIEPKQVNLKLLLPLMEGASVEEDEVLATKWAALLANAATHQGDMLVEPSFADVLRQLTPVQAQILDELYKQVNGAHLQDEAWGRQTLNERQVREALKLEFAQFERCMDNLLRLRLCAKNTPAKTTTLFSSNGYTTIEPTLFGYAFVTACKPPIK
ncbi:Abi-alpha family protein [Hymenobacter sp. YC55]|uniref:Abi-alpha family protein n=1 Tax=Hymenobacter sp. YC55 TaxID=3034019 RepID=UPI0023F83781|nr:Abi-alpha family protein [Hymenobacter sp. YC55]MDF7810915.1 Abi-alpha family protein [Hymenobacter sp. YC55]